MTDNFVINYAMYSHNLIRSVALKAHTLITSYLKVFTLLLKLTNWNGYETYQVWQQFLFAEICWLRFWNRTLNTVDKWTHRKKRPARIMKGKIRIYQSYNFVTMRKHCSYLHCIDREKQYAYRCHKKVRKFIWLMCCPEARVYGRWLMENVWLCNKWGILSK
jgi:hypothetical protein